MGDRTRLSGGHGQPGGEHVSRERVGVFGGTFDPIHVGHLAAVEDAADLLGLERVLFVPNRIPPHKLDRQITAAEDRVAMVELAIADNPLFELSLIEIDHDDLSYTLDTMRALAAERPESDLVFLAGSDSLRDLHTWHEPDALLGEFSLAFMQRPGSSLPWPDLESRFPGVRERVELVSVPKLEISSEDIRARVADGRPTRYYLVPDVERYIRTHRLYDWIAGGHP
jgi:nicotinate-nucleotide adenylyltransferase